MRVDGMFVVCFFKIQNTCHEYEATNANLQGASEGLLEKVPAEEMT